jgi:hypothetical protein
MKLDPGIHIAKHLVFFGSITFWKTRPGEQNSRQRHSPTHESDTSMKISLIIYPITQWEDAVKHNKLH